MRYLLFAAFIPLAIFGKGLTGFISAKTPVKTVRAETAPTFEQVNTTASILPPVAGSAASDLSRQAGTGHHGGQTASARISSPSSAPSSSANLLAADPFSYRVPQGTEGFVPSATVNIPQGIKVLGILKLESGHALAALQLPGDDGVYYVKQGDDLQIGSTAKRVAARGSSSRRPTSSGKPAASGIFYLKINKIEDDYVEVYPENNPGNVHIYR